MCKKIALLASTWILCSSASAQLYPTRHRPPNQHWQQLVTSHFKIVFPQGEDTVAWKTARILEKAYPKVQELTGGGLSNFPVILTNYNDRSNGLVTTLHFRSEIDIPPIQGKTLNPETGGWLENVVPHELVHALHFSHMGGAGIGRLVSFFSPDLARSIHGASPGGIREGLATYYESENVAPGGGRGNYPFFYNQFNAVFDSPSRWSMGQMVHFPANARPFDRHYIGGYEFTQWLQQVYGAETSRVAIDFNIRWPFLGYGLALKHATGQWPAHLYNDFEEDREKERSSNRSSFKSIQLLPVPYEGSEIRRPKWLNDSTLIFHGSFYNAEPGFYRYELNTGSMERIVSTRSVSDFNYALSDDKDSFIYSYYQPDAIYPNAFKSTLVTFSLAENTTEKVKNPNRFFAPDFTSDSTLIALQTHHTWNKLAELTPKLTNHSINTLFTDPHSQLISAAAHPKNKDSLAVVMNQDGNQALWIASKNHLDNNLREPPRISFPDGSIFDPVWHPGGGRLLFSADFSGALQVYEFDLQTGSITQLTQAPYNAFEASYSPNGNRIAFILQRENEHLPAVLSRDDFYGKTISTHTQATAAIPEITLKKESDWLRQSYSTGFSWLKPRTVLPAIEDIPGSNNEDYHIGVGLYSSDLLQAQAYALELTTAKERLWYDLTYQNKQFFPGVEARISSKPALRHFTFETGDQQQFSQRFLRQERSFALSIPMQFTLEQNVDFTGIFVEPEIRLSQLRYFNRDGTNPTDFSNATVGNILGQFNYKLQQNIRDLQPHSGLVVYSELEHFWGSDGLTLKTPRGEVPLDFSRPTALRGGLFTYVAPLHEWNQSLRLGLEALTQTAPVFNNQSIVSDGFSESIFPAANNLFSLSSRYTIPLVYPENGGLLVPLYLSTVYLSGFTNTVIDPTAANWLKGSRSVLGAGLRVQFRISNLSIDIGGGIGFEPSRNKIHYFIGDF